MFRKFALFLCLRKLAANEFTYSVSNNYLAARLVDRTTGQIQIVKEKSDKGYVTLKFPTAQQSSEPKENIVSAENLSNYNFQFDIFYAGGHKTTSLPIVVILEEMTFGYFRSRISKWYQTRIKPRFIRYNSDRIFVLTSLVENHLNNKNTGLPQSYSELSAFISIYGLHALYSPRHKQELKKFSLIVDSLKDSGEIANTKDGFRITGKALTTISQNEIDSRRHNDSERHKKSITALTYAIVLIALIDLVRAVFAHS